MVDGPPRDAHDWRRLGVQFRQEGQLAAAIDALRRSLECAPEDALAWSELAHALRWQGRLDEARDAAARAVNLAPDLAGAWFNLGAVQVALGDAARGAQSYRKALELSPDFAEAWSNLGEALGAAGDRPGEIAAYRRAIAANPGLAPVWSNLGKAFVEAGEIDEAVTACRRATEIDPNFALAWINLAHALLERGESGEAVRAGERAVGLAPASGEAWTNLGCALMERGELESSLAAHRQALERMPHGARAHYNHGLALERCGRHDAAIDAYRRAVALDPAFAAAWMRLACVLLAGGDFEAGWAAYEWRWRDRDARPKRFEFTPWAGERVPGRRLLLWGEQGIGDEILHASMVGDLAEAGLRVTLEIDPRLVPLMRRSFPGVAVVARADPASLDPRTFDSQCPLASLGRWLRPSFDAFPRRRAYLLADRERAGQYAARLRRGEADTLVGISWSSANRETGTSKTCALADWADLLGVPGARFVDLQYGDTQDARDDLRRRHGIAISHLDDLDLTHDLDGLAALCAACDLVITVSNVTAHVAGALGRPVWLLAPAAKGRIWYWFHGRRDSPWYPSMRIFTQPTPGDWSGVLDTVANKLVAFVRNR